MTPSSRARAAAALVLSALILTSCGNPAPGPAPTPSAAASETTGEDETNGTVAADQQFSFDQVATFPDGLEVSLGGTEVRRATATQTGAQVSGGQVVVVSVVLENKSRAAYDPRSAVITALYGADDTPATMITDSTAELQSGFDAPVAAGDEDTTAVGFAIPDAGLAQVTVIVDLNDDVNDAISFSGQVEKS